MNAGNVPIADFSAHTQWLRRGGHLTMLALLVLALIFYKERTLLLDVAYQTFLMMAEGKPQIMVHRFGVVLVQALPLMAIKLQWPLPVVLMLYSASFPLLFWLFYWLIANVLKNPYLGWALIGLYTWIAYDAFYWAPSEQQQAMGLVLVVFAFVMRYPALQRPWMWALMFLAAPALAYYHPLVFIPFFFLWIYGALVFPGMAHRRYWAIAAWMVIVLVLKALFSGNWYDDNKYDTFFTNLINYFPHYWELPSNYKFIIHTIKYWYLLPISLAGLSAYYLYQRQKRQLILLWVFMLGHLFLLHIASPNASYRFYAEVNYLPLMIYTGVPLMIEVLPRIGTPFRLVTLLLLVAAFRLTVIALHHKPYTVRLQWLEQQLGDWQSKHDNRKFYMPADKAPLDTLLMTWGTPYETLLLSALKEPGKTATLAILPDPAAHQQALDQPGFFVSEFKDLPLQYLHSPYFSIDAGAYKAVLPSIMPAR